MEKNSKFLKILSILLIIILGISILFFGYTTLSIKNIEAIKKDNNTLNEELKIKNIEEEKLFIEYNEKKDKLENSTYEFSSLYGYNLKDKKENILLNTADRLKSENKNILKQIESAVLKYNDYFNGAYYNDESFINLVSDFSSLIDLKSTESLSTDLYRDINFNAFNEISKENGTINYLNSLNRNSKENNILYFSTAMYSIKLNKVLTGSIDIEKNLDSIYAEIINLTDLYSNLERYGLNTGYLTSYRLSELKEEISRLSKEYYMNLGVIEILEIGDNNEKIK